MKSIIFVSHARLRSKSTLRVRNKHLITTIQHHGKLIQILLVHAQMNRGSTILTTYQSHAIPQHQHTLRCRILRRARQNGHTIQVPLASCNFCFLSFLLSTRHLIHAEDRIICHQLLAIPYRHLSLCWINFHPQPHRHHNQLLTYTNVRRLNDTIQQHNHILRAFLSCCNSRHVVTFPHSIHLGTRMHTRKISRHIDTTAYLASLSPCNTCICHKWLQQQNRLTTLLFQHQTSGLFQFIRAARPEGIILCSKQHGAEAK